MKKKSEYDKRQLRLMHDNLISFEKNQIDLSSLVGSLEFLLVALESVDDQWEENFLKEITTLESINAIEIIKNSEEDITQIKKEKREELIKKSILNLKTLIKKELHE